MGLERLARYCARPPFAQNRLSRADPDTVVYSLKRPDPRGRTVLYLTPIELLKRLAALIPPPRVHRHTYSGVLAPHSPMRKQVIESAGPAGTLDDRLKEAARAMGMGTKEAPDTPGPNNASRLCWAMLIARIYETMPLSCPRCQAPMRIISFITQPDVITRILDHIGQPTRPPPLAPAVSLFP
jgi:hypothetical protein